MKSPIDLLKTIAKRFSAPQPNQGGRSRLVNRRKTQNSLTFEALQPRQLLATMATTDGDWFDPTIWDNGLPDASQRAIIGHGVTVELDGASHVAEELVIHGNLVVPEDVSAPNKKLTTRWIHVNSDGVFQVGSEADRYDEGTFTIELTGSDVEFDPVVETNMNGMGMSTMNITNNDGFLMTASGGSVQFYGEEKLSFTKLSATVIPGETTITVENRIERNFDQGAVDGNGDFITTAADDGELDWEIGDQIVIASSSYDYTEEDVRRITDVFNNGTTTTLTLDSGLTYRHYGETETYGESAEAGTSPAAQTHELDLRAEVALLSRNVKVQSPQGSDSQDTDIEFGDRANAIYETRVRAGGLSDAEAAAAPAQQVANGVGGHLMFMKSSGQITVDGVQLDGLGQTSQKGRYPIHWHLGDGKQGDVMRNSSVTNSNNRGVTIHGTSELRIEGVVLHDIHGHGFFFEDAVETGNVLVANIALGIHKVGGNDANFANPGGTDPFVVDSHDSVLETGSRFESSAAFWITNPDNTFVGNIAAGGAGTGFWYAIPRTAIGASGLKAQYAETTPIYAEFGQFDNNSSHSTPVGLNFDRGSDIEDARFSSDPITVGSQNNYSPRVGGVEGGDRTSHTIRNFTNYKSTDAAFYHRGDAETILLDGLKVADSFNGPWAVSENLYDNSLFVGHSRGNGDFSQDVGGPRLYDGAGLYTNTHFAGFGGENAFAFQVEGSSFGPTMYHAFRGTSFEADGTYGNISHAVSDFNQNPDDGHALGQPSRWIKGVIDLDGTLTGAVNGGSGFSIVPNVDFLVDGDDVQPAGWDAWLTDDIYARIRVENNNDGEVIFPSEDNDGPFIRFIARDGDSVDVTAGQNNGDRSWTQIAAKADSDGTVEGTLTIEFLRNGVPANGFVLNMDNQDGERPSLDSAIQAKVDAARIVVRIVAAGNYTPDNSTEVFSEADLRSATGDSVFYRGDAGDLFLNSAINNDFAQSRISLTPGDPLQTAFTSRTIEYGATIEAEEFDNGVNGIAYNDTGATNSLGTFRDDTGVDVTPTRVGNIADGEWLEYTTNVVTTSVASFYRIGVNVSSTAAGGQVRILGARVNSAGIFEELGTVDVPDTGGEFSTQWINGLVDLTSVTGTDSAIRLEFVGGGFEVDSVKFDAPTQTAFVDQTITADLNTTRIELEEFDDGGQNVAYNDTTPTNDAGGDRVGDGVDHNGDILTNDVIDGEWLEYTRDIHAGSYDITLGVSWTSDNKGVKLSIGDSNSALEFEPLGQFVFGVDEADEVLTLTNVDLTQWAGEDRTIRIEIVGDFMGINWLEFTSLTQAAPTADIVDVSPNPRNTDAGVVAINFDEDVSGVDIGDLTLTRDGNAIDISGLTLTQITPSQYSVDLSTVTATDGAYELNLSGNGSGIQDASGNAMVANAMDQFMVEQVGPQVESVVFNDGSAQRSMVTEITVSFSEVVNGVDESSFILMNTTSNTQIVPTVITQVLDGKTIATLTFSGSGINGGSLADGDYSLTTLSSGVADTAGNLLDGDGDGTSGDNVTDTFFRFFGDSNGDRIVNVFDLLQFRRAFGQSGESEFDFSGDGIVNVLDLLQFRRRFGQTL